MGPLSYIETSLCGERHRVYSHKPR